MAPVDMLQTFQMALDSQFAGGEWWTINVLSLMISIGVIAVGYAVAAVMKSSELKGWVNEEFSQFLFSAVIIGLLVVMIPIVQVIAISLFDGDYFESGRTYFVELTGKIEGSITRMTVLRTTYSVFEKTRIPIPAWFIAVGYGAPMKAPIGPFMTLQKMLYPALMSSLAQLELLNFMKNTMFTFILPIGIALRAFPVTRRTGSTLIAIAVVGYVIYPLSVNYGLVMYNSVKDEIGQGETPLPGISVYGDLINREHPIVDTKYMSKDDYIRWSVLVPKYGYRIWKNQDCSAYPSISWKSEDQPPRDTSYKIWELTEDSEPVCYESIRRGEGKFGEPVIFRLENETVEENKDLSMIFEVYNIYDNGTANAIGYDKISVFVGDPCKKSLFNSIGCYAGYDFTGRELTATGTGLSIGTGFKDAMVDLAKNSGWVRAAQGDSVFWKSKALFTPFLASYTFLDFTESLPQAMFPAFMSVFTLVFSLVVSVASFRGISQMMRGESSIQQLGRLV